MNLHSLGHPRGFALSSSPGLGAGDKTIGFAVAMSLLIHGIGLGWLPGMARAKPDAAPSLQVRLAEPLVQRDPVQREAVPPVREREPMIEAPREANPSRQASLPVLTQPARQDWKDMPTQNAVEPPVVRGDDAVPPAPTFSTVPAPPFEADLLAGYGRQLTAAVASHQRYPRLALLRQWQGNALLRLEFGPDSRLFAVRVLSSSGYEALDQQALEMVREASPLPPLPAALAGRTISVDVPVVFRIAS
jgi:protein TonB